MSYTLRVSVRERQQLEEIAAEVGVSTQRLLLESALARKTKTATEVQASRREFRTARQQLAEIANTLVEVADVAPGDVAALIASLAAATRRLNDALIALQKPAP